MYLLTETRWSDPPLQSGFVFMTCSYGAGLSAARRAVQHGCWLYLGWLPVVDMPTEAPSIAVATNVMVPVQLAQLALQRRNSDALAKIDHFLDSLVSTSPSNAALVDVASQSPLASPDNPAGSPKKKLTLDGATHVDMHHELGIDILVNVFSEFEASGMTGYSSKTQRDEEKKQLWLLRQSLAKQRAAPGAVQSPSKHDLLKDRYGVGKPLHGTVGSPPTRRALFSKQKQPSSFNLGVLMEVEMEHRLKELFAVASGYNTTMNTDQVHKLSGCVVDTNQSLTVGGTPVEPAERAQRVRHAAHALLHKDGDLTFGSFKTRFVQLNPRRSIVHTQQVAWVDSIYQAIVNPSSCRALATNGSKSPQRPHERPPVQSIVPRAVPSTTTVPAAHSSPTKPAPTSPRPSKQHVDAEEDKQWMAHAAREVVTPMVDPSVPTAQDSATGQKLLQHDLSGDALDALGQSIQQSSPVRRRAKRDSVDLSKEMGAMPRRKKRDSVDLTHAKREKERPPAIVYDNKGQAPNIRQKLHECKVMMLSLSNLNFGKK
ncbi:hypothetical protein H310_09467 [Aphanomyces invadans]|uniref:Uncharacterized protein n=1 Tax=Aphanomyces invadans TaxID=157072 RepID=A0A024TW34_9STRA|nr:hypothetical protein H310_09467 [Aphanomyces invadans]ETV97562.1 hypothetical protein H310_09467 [Aphanomyces invadans]|eukprot:XP_008873771.1 hypothetical protein H310_09467 [Aphanomyces invadans]